MEEILSSIKRIIADDADASDIEMTKKASAARDAERESHRKAIVASLAKDADDSTGSSYVDEVLELTDEMPQVGRGAKNELPQVPDDESPSAKSDIVEPEDMTDENALELTDALEIEEAETVSEPVEPAKVEAAKVEPAKVEQVAKVEPVQVETQAKSEIPVKNETIVSSDSEAATRTSLAALSSLLVKPEAGENTLEGLVREMLRPMLKEWLDANLPTLVESMVSKEIARITGRAL